MFTRMTLLGSITVSLICGVLSCSDTGKFTDVTRPDPAATTLIAVSPDSSTLPVGDTVTLKATLTDANGNSITGSPSWTTSDTLIARVSQSGVVSGIASGAVTVTAQRDNAVHVAHLWIQGIPTDTSAVARADTTLSLVKGAATTLSTLSPSTSAAKVAHFAVVPKASTLQVGQTAQFATSMAWSDGQSHLYTVSYIASSGSISATGSYVATVPGTSRIIAACSCGVADTAIITVRSLAATLVKMTLMPATVTLQPGATQQFVVGGTWSDGSSLAPGASFTATGGTISASGAFIAGSAPGQFRVIAAQQGGTKVDTAIVTISAPPAAATLRQLASARHFAIGVAVNQDAFQSDPQYRQVLAQQYNVAVPETGNSMKMGPVHPGPTTYYFAASDAFVSWARSNGMAVNGSALVWDGNVPSWLSSGTFTKAQMLAVLKDYVTTVVSRYAGRVAEWDVVNEVLAWNGTLRPTIFLNAVGPEYIDSSFVWAHRADPSAKLYINDYDAEGLGIKADGLLALVQQLRARGIPIDGVGFQSHFPTHAGTIPSASSMLSNLTRFATAGFAVRISEMDVALPNAGVCPTSSTGLPFCNAGLAGSAQLQAQATVYRDALDVCLRVSSCAGLTTWGVTDRYSAVPKLIPGFGRALPLDSNFNTKPAFDSLAARLQRP